ncbi:hypothetical protein SODALDRAFT_334816 [Sodiomyces alkalinus F11]|uniref:DNA replication factor Cdt1 C-terminal domain-containing protein n=1 Tax=Sodiomyces alkalinus (strain CBS 110278 / VKM F-3762 / F11) TaxID=1314773 RepID=A0A3N2PT43_SODAK|nr:hypothetical protein SODALDRAFT_334816 [Sodiomyces alkalinus F11]ROT37692.1 hypothetical protein SODALDRAFT_334816 [Sodiomyces alkalinus F11]
MARVANRRQVQRVVKPVTTNSISKYARLSKAQVSSVDGPVKKVLAACIPNSKAYEPVTVTVICDTSDEENNNTSVRPSVALAVPEKADILVKDRTPNKKKRKAPTEDDGTSPTTPSASKSLKRQRVKRDASKDEIPAAASPSVTKRSAKSVSSHSTQLTLAETYRKVHKSTLISSAKKDGRDSVRKVGRSKEAGPHVSSKRPAEREAAKSRLPAELLELLDLQKAILKTVILQITHQNNNTPIDISDITPQVSRTWGKRKVTVDDIRRCIAIQDLKPAKCGAAVAAAGSPFIVTDYGRGKLCLEIDTSKTTGAIDEDALCRQFEKNLHILCAERITDDMNDLDVSFDNLSFDDLPKADITPRHNPLTGKQNPLLAKGHRALAELKSGIAIKQQEKETKHNAIRADAAPEGKKMSLLDRIRAKEMANSQIQLPSGPELGRKRAIMRACDVAAIIGMLASSSNPNGLPVLSFTMAVLQQKLKDSLRVPMPVEEGIDTVKILANEVAPEWFRVVSMGGKEHVVIQTRRKPYDTEIAARVGRL